MARCRRSGYRTFQPSKGKQMNRRAMMQSTLLASLAVAGTSAFAQGVASGAAAPAAGFRQEKGSMGALNVPADRLWGAQTQRSLETFGIGGDLGLREPVD